MRIHITVEDDILDDLDAQVGPRRRSAFIVQALRAALEDRHRWDEIESALGSVPDHGHEWDIDPAGWVRSQRRVDTRRVG